MSSPDCSLYTPTAGCDGMVCNTDWTKASAAQTVRNSFCKPFTGNLAVCGTTCGLTKWGSDCCSANDWQSCFTKMAKKSCSNGGSNGMAGQTHALGQTSIISTISGHALQVTSTGTASTATSTSSGGQMTGSSTSSSSPTATSRSHAERSISFGSKMTMVRYAQFKAKGPVR